MTHFDLKLGYLCNNNCIHCVVADQRKRTQEYYDKEANRSFIQIISLLKDYRKKGVNAITLTGGEPTIRKDFFDIVNFAKDYFSISLQTNGRAFSYDWFSKRLSEIIANRPNLKKSFSFIIALHGPNEKIHDSITRTKNSFKQTTNGLKNLISLGQLEHIYIKIVLSKYNVNHILSLFKFIKSLGLNNISLAHPHGNGNAEKYFYDVVPMYSKYQLELNKALTFAKENNMLVHLEAIPYCFLNPEFRTLKNDYEPIDSILYQLDMEDPSDWYDIRKSIRSKNEFCKNCIYNNSCEGVWNDYEQGYGLDELKSILDGEEEH